jgi:hypothetical protein
MLPSPEIPLKKGVGRDFEKKKKKNTERMFKKNQDPPHFYDIYYCCFPNYSTVKFSAEYRRKPRTYV